MTALSPKPTPLIRSISRPSVFVGHSAWATSLAGCEFDLQAAVKGLPPTPRPPSVGLAAEAGLVGGFFEVFARPPELPSFRRTAEGFEVDYPPRLERHYALDETLAGIDALLRLERSSGGRVRLIRSLDALNAAREEGAFAALLHLADADAIDPELKTLSVLHAAGVRSLAITWSRQNAFGYGAPYRSPGTPDVGPGLTEAGLRLVRACNALGLVIDLAHLNEAGFWDVAKHSTAPLVVTHGAAHALSPTSRALTDRQLAAIADSGGVVGISLEAVDEGPEGRVGAMLRHLDYLLTRLGPDGVALGSDLYCKPDPAFPGGRSLLPELLTALEARGHGESVLAKLTHANWMRVLTATW
jgi:membrane dipeptidase